MLAAKSEKSQHQLRHQLVKWHHAFQSRVVLDSHHCLLTLPRDHQHQLTFNKFKHCHHHPINRELRQTLSSRHVDNQKASHKMKFSKWVPFNAMTVVVGAWNLFMWKIFCLDFYSNFMPKLMTLCPLSRRKNLIDSSVYTEVSLVQWRKFKEIVTESFYNRVSTPFQHNKKAAHSHSQIRNFRHSGEFSVLFV